VVSAEFVDRILNCVAVVDSKVVLTDVEVAREAAALFSRMNREWWAGPLEAFIYNEFADALREGIQLGILHLDDLMTDDARVLAKLDASKSPLIAFKLDRIRNLPPNCTRDYQPQIIPKERWLDPPVLWDGTVRRLSELAPEELQAIRDQC
jgi:hypothetical protein